MNEGWASYWHARACYARARIPAAAYLPRRDPRTDVVRPFASGEQTALAINPYHLGFTLWSASSTSTASRALAR